MEKSCCGIKEVIWFKSKVQAKYLEGVHRLCALHLLKAKSFPALVVVLEE
jgi:hypothetical protein